MATAPSGLSSAMSNPSAFMNNISATQTVPGGSQNVNPLGGSVFSTLASTSPTVATLPGQGTAAGSYPGMNITVPGGITGGAATNVMLPGLGGSTTGATVPSGTSTPGTTTSTGTGAAGGYNPSSGVTNPNAPTTEAGSKTMLGDFQATYGQGTGTALANTLGGLGTATSSAEQLMLQPTEQAAQATLANIQASEAASGVSADSSTAALAAAGLGGQVSTAVAGEMGQIGLNEENTLISALQQEGTQHGPDVSGWDQFGNVMQGIGSAAVGLGESYFLGGGSLSDLTGLFGKGASDTASTSAAIQQTDFSGFGMMG